MDGLTRRTLLRASGEAGATALLAGAAGVTLEHVMARGQSDPLPANNRVLVLVTMCKAMTGSAPLSRGYGCRFPARGSRTHRCEQTFGPITSDAGAEAGGDTAGNGQRAALSAQARTSSLGASRPTCRPGSTRCRRRDSTPTRTRRSPRPPQGDPGRPADHAFRSALAGSTHEKDVVVVAYSEFGRQ